MSPWQKAVRQNWCRDWLSIPQGESLGDFLLTHMCPIKKANCSMGRPALFNDAIRNWWVCRTFTPNVGPKVEGSLFNPPSHCFQQIVWDLTRGLRYLTTSNAAISQLAHLVNQIDVKFQSLKIAKTGCNDSEISHQSCSLRCPIGDGCYLEHIKYLS